MREDFAEGVPTVVVKLDQERKLAFTLGSLRRVKEKLGTLELDLSDDPDKAATIGTKLATYLWCCMAPGDRRALSVEEIEDMIHPGNMGAITDSVRALFKASSPEASENPTAEVPAEPAAAGT